MSQQATARSITHRTGGHGRHGITRLVSPSDIGQLIKPFVFLDHFAMNGHGSRMKAHPHSGIATVTVVLDGSLYYRETTGAEGTLPTGGVEFMSAGGGVWHEGGAGDAKGVTGFQLWLALPESDELSPAHSHYAGPGEIGQAGPARVVLGSYGGVSSPIRTTASINYLHVRLADGERWTYVPPAGHKVAWTALSSGALRTGGALLGKEIAVFEESGQAIEFVAEGDTEFVIGSSAKHPHELVMGYYSVHTSAAALVKGEAGIDRIGTELRQAGKLAA